MGHRAVLGPRLGSALVYSDRKFDPDYQGELINPKFDFQYWDENWKYVSAFVIVNILWLLSFVLIFNEKP